MITRRLAIALLTTMIPYGNPISFLLSSFILCIIFDCGDMLLIGFFMVLQCYLIIVLAQQPYVRSSDNIHFALLLFFFFFFEP